MQRINKYQTLIILLSVCLGIFIGQNDSIATWGSKMIIPFLMIMLLSLFMSVSFHDLRKSILNIRFSLASVLINFVSTPLIACGLGSIFLSQHEAIWIGFVMLMVTPCTDWYLVFTASAKGNVNLSASILPVNFMLQVILLPIYLMFFFKHSGQIDWLPLLYSIFWILIVPFVTAHFLNRIKQSLKNSKTDKALNFLQEAQVIFLALTVIAMFASEGEVLLNNLNIIYLLLTPIILFFIINFLVGKGVSKVLRFNYADSVSLLMTTLARNSPIALAVAVVAFASEPLVALVLVIQPLIELPILVGIARTLLYINKEK